MAKYGLTYHEEFLEKIEVEVRDYSISHTDKFCFSPIQVLTLGPSFPGAPSTPELPGSPCQIKASVIRLKVSSLKTCQEEEKPSRLAAMYSRCSALKVALEIHLKLHLLDGGGVGGRSRREGLKVYIKLIHFIVQQKLTQHCKAILLQ